MKTLADILYRTGITEVIGNTHIEVTSITSDSRDVRRGACFVAVSGTQVDGHQFITKAIENGASSIICEQIPAMRVSEVTYVKVRSTQVALGICASNFYDNPSSKLRLVAVTGTNGKTTVTSLLYQLFEDMGFPCGLISTIDIRINGVTEIATHTTPNAVHLQQHLARMVDAGVEYCFMEASSHGIVQERMAGISPTGALFTNLSHDHLDYHKTVKNYIAAKKKLFDDLPSSAFAIYNADDRNGQVMVQNTKAKVKSFSIQRPADFHVKILENDINGLLLRTEDTEFFSTLNGRFNASNLTAVIAVAQMLDMSLHNVLLHVSKLKPAVGRFEKIPLPNGVTAIVDYAHTPDALEKVISSIVELKTPDQTLTVVMGCGGNRDKDKRPVMGSIAGSLSDKVIFTSDNPRDEDPDAILDDIEAGVEIVHRKKCLRITDRKQAILAALSQSINEDIVLIAGKGHETYQEIKGVRHEFDDRHVIQTFIQQLS
ncbi:MAG: UDP-N-acetylmuramoyl-L-alanyl-D-glutamate--2,6-diaminopimelate ligase [Cryomorphaceae bacterium]|nr:UDP-N-acetylmuramoyl-L-alanyl-D-glutamate--2,6-diaminopimelate ligase [Cryomorphaceae bacterium]